MFDFVADERNEPRYNPRLLWVKQTSTGPIGRGTRFRAEIKTLGRPAAMTIEITTYEQPHRLASSTHMSTFVSTQEGFICLSEATTVGLPLVLVILVATGFVASFSHP